MQAVKEKAQEGMSGSGKDDFMNNILSKSWWRASLIRCIRTIAQTAVATIGTAVAMGDVNWPLVLSASALAGVLSLCTSVAGLPEVEA